MMKENEIENQNEILSREYEINPKVLKISIQLPKILIPCIEDICIITRRNRDCLFSYFIICGLIGFYDEPERIFNFAKKIPDFSERLQIGLENSNKEDYPETKKFSKPENTVKYNSTKENKIEQTQLPNKFKNGIQDFEFRLMLPDILIESFTIFCEITNRTMEDLSKMVIIDQLAFIYQNPELIYEYIKDYETIMENLRTGLNLILGKDCFKKK